MAQGGGGSLISAPWWLEAAPAATAGVSLGVNAAGETPGNPNRATAGAFLLGGPGEVLAGATGGDLQGLGQARSLEVFPGLWRGSWAPKVTLEVTLGVCPPGRGGRSVLWMGQWVLPRLPITGTPDCLVPTVD